ncbi:MAG TPA: hypothetical protein ENN07_07065, partial [candidate division Zixibacteria bacterium]|nr:hypothetical protein [candidate division Zixibacteria bacterium]
MNRSGVILFCAVVLIVMMLFASSASPAVVFGRVAFEDGEPAEGIDIIGLAFSSPLPSSAVTDSAGEYMIRFSLLPGMGDTFFVIGTAPEGFYHSPEFFREYMTSTDTLYGRDFELRPEGVPTMNLSVWTKDSLGAAFQGVQISVRLNEEGSTTLIDSTDYGGRVVFTLTREGDYIVTADREGFFSVPEAETVFVGAHVPIPSVRFTMHTDVFVSPYWLYVFASDSLGEPVESLFVEWEKEGESGRYPLWTDEDGFASANPPTEGVYYMRALHSNPELIVVPNWASLELSPEEPVDTAFFSVLADTTNIAERNLPMDYTISISPNPFNSGARISIEAEERLIVVEIFDILGRKIDELANFDTG